ncbi:MAG: hypothetical protein WC901_08115 [Candidatus Margulisiibacteriota bacterium]
MVIRKVEYKGGENCKPVTKPASNPSTANQSKGEPVNTKVSGGTGVTNTAPPPIIEERPYTMGQALQKAIDDCQALQAAIKAGQITSEQLAQFRRIVGHQLG